MVTPVHGSFTFVGLTSGITYTKDVYLSDVAASLINFDSGIGAKATSDQFFLVPEACILVDVSIVTGPTVIGRLQIIRNSISTGDILGIIEHVSSNSDRPKLSIPFGAGEKVGAIELAL